MRPATSLLQFAPRGPALAPADMRGPHLAWWNQEMDEFREEPSKYLWRWTTYSWVCVGVGVLIALLGVTSGGSVTPWLVFGVLVALIGGIAFGFVPRASLGQEKRQMTNKPERKNSGK